MWLLCKELLGTQGFEQKMNSSCLYDLQVNRATEVVVKDFVRKLVT